MVAITSNVLKFQKVYRILKVVNCRLFILYSNNLIAMEKDNLISIKLTQNLRKIKTLGSHTKNVQFVSF